MAGLSNEEINNIQKSANIVDIISSYISLEKKGKNYFGVCPFHDDHNPSMSVNDEKGLFTCFVCHKTGNVFNFVADYENVSFIEAVKIVAEKIGLKLDFNFKTNSKYDRHYEVMDLANKIYQNNLRTQKGEIARKYLKERGINDEIKDEFQIGLSFDSYNELSDLLIKSNFDENILLDVGLCNQGNSLYDIFRNRITFPIHNSNGKIVGFSARIFKNEENEAKYINTKETSIFKKGEILFNYHRANQEARRVKKIILVEGQMDAIRVYANGVKNVVATMGTALTNEHINLLKKLNVPVILCLDNDDAGEKATISSGELLTSNNVETYVVRLNGKKDPDEYIIEYGIDKYKEAIENAITYFDFKLNYYKKGKNLNKVDDVSNYINSIIKELNKTNDDILINLTVNKLSEEYGIDKNVLLNKIIKVKPTEMVKAEIKNSIKKNKNDKLCELLLYYMINDIRYINGYNNELGYIPSEKYLKIANDILAFYLKYNYINIADFITYEVSNDNYEEVLEVIDNNINTELSDTEFIGLINKIKRWTDEDKISKYKAQLKTTSDINEKLRINDEIAKLKRRMWENEESN